MHDFKTLKSPIELWDEPDVKGCWIFDGQYIFDPAGNKYTPYTIRGSFWYSAMQKEHEGRLPQNIRFMKQYLERQIAMNKRPLEIKISQGDNVLEEMKIDLFPPLLK